MEDGVPELRHGGIGANLGAWRKEGVLMPGCGGARAELRDRAEGGRSSAAAKLGRQPEPK